MINFMGTNHNFLFIRAISAKFGSYELSSFAENKKVKNLTASGEIIVLRPALPGERTSCDTESTFWPFARRG
jgi:hypothetical protein